MKSLVACIAGSGAVAAGFALMLRAGPPAGGPAAASAAEPPAEPPAARRATVLRQVHFEGSCDASGAVPVDERHFAVADDENNVLRVYDAFEGGKPVRKTNLSKQLGLKKKGEADIEAATSLGDRAFWLTSHGRNAKGKEDPNRSLVITTELPTTDEKVELEGGVYRELLSDLMSEPSLSRYELGRAADLAPKEPGGLNIEGLTATPEGKLLIGFRSPLAGTRAIIVPVENPAAFHDGDRPRFGAPIELELGGLGVRSLSWWRGAYLIAAGSTASGGPARLYRWSGPGSEPELVAGSALRGANPEAFFTAEGNDEILLLSDDGTREMRGKPCKKLRKQKHKSFRGLWLKLPGKS